jgi:hypothetical protein
MSKSNRRIAVAINYGSLILLLALFYTVEKNSVSTMVIIGMAAAIVIVLISFIFVFAKTGLWRLVHAKADKLDERQIMVTFESLRHSYAIFSILTLSVIFTNELLEEFTTADLPLLPIFAVLLYLAHTLPASIIAWTDKEI